MCARGGVCAWARVRGCACARVLVGTDVCEGVRALVGVHASGCLRWPGYPCERVLV